jgi:membrane fusion protein (multidrug efflux system)
MFRIATALLLVALLGGCGKDEGPGPAGTGDDIATPVVTAQAASRPWSAPLTGIATLRAREAVTLTAPASGRVAEVLFREGQAVPQGALLLRLEDDEQRADHEAAAANAELQATRAARVRELHGKGLVSSDELDAAAQALRDAQARAELARVRLDLRRIRAPFAGVLGFRQVSPGALVQPGDAIVTLDALDSLRADFPVPETQLALLAPGTPVTGQTAAFPGRTFSGELLLIDTRVDPLTRAVTAQARFDNRDRVLKPGMLLTLNVPARARDALFVPEAALLPENARQYVWRVDGGIATRVEVQTGVRQQGDVEIVAGLAAGDIVVVEGQGNLRDGRTVTATARAAAP